VAAVFDGKLLRLYVNGSLAGESPSKMSAINQGKNFFIGSVIGNPDATDVNFTATSAFKGFIDEVKLYKRALGVEEVRGQYEAQAAQDRDAMFEAPCVPVRNGKTIRKSKVAVTAGPRGGIQISNGNSFFTLDSRFSYPGDKVGWNVLSETEGAGEAAWRTTVRRVNSSSLRIEAWSDRYLLVRIIRLGKGRIEIEDLLKNRTAEPVGVMIEHGIVTPVAMTNVSVGNSAETPTLFFSQEEGDFGIVAEDDIGRL
jgi:hypothetical protein